MNSYNYFIYPYSYDTSKTNAVLLTSLKNCQQLCIGKCRCYDLYTTPICNVQFKDAWKLVTEKVPLDQTCSNRIY